MTQISPGKIASAERRQSHRTREQHVTGLIRQPAGQPLEFYTDGSVSGRPVDKIGRLTGWGYIATDGRYGCGKYRQYIGKGGTEQSLPGVTELRAIWHAIGEEVLLRPVKVVTDSREAAATINRWKSGSTAMPVGYVGSTKPGKTPTLERLRLLVVTHPDRITVEQVRGHSGVTLNEGADALALLGMRWARDGLDHATVVQRAAFIAEGFLDQFRSRR